MILQNQQERIRKLVHMKENPSQSQVQMKSKGRVLLLLMLQANLQ
jgi:hypothetical protein